MQTPQQPTIELEVAPDAVADWFYPLLDNQDRYVLLWGGRDSTKSDGWALKLLLECIRLPYFKCLMLRKIADTVAASQWATLKSVAEREGIDHLFFFGISPCVIRCLENGNVFLARGLDKPRKLKSTKDPTHAWFEEANETTEDDGEVVDTTLRTSKAGAVIQVAYTFNPDHEGDYKQFWLYKKFFDQTGHPDGLSFRGTLDEEVDGEIIRTPYTVAHATIRDNPWATKERVAKYKSYGRLIPETGKMADAYRYRVWYQGLWASKRTDNEFYVDFSRAHHAAEPLEYLPGLPLLSSWDANALPYSHMLLAQPEATPNGGTVLRFFHEYALPPPRSGIKNTAAQFLLDRKANGWQSSALFLTGDATLRNRKIGEESGSLFDDVASYTLPALSSSSTDLWPRRNASVMRRRDFINAVLRGAIEGLSIRVDPALTYLLADLEQIQTGVEGKVKVKFKDKELGATYEKLGHASDNFDYLCLSHPAFAAAYEAFKAGRDD